MSYKVDISYFWNLKFFFAVLSNKNKYKALIEIKRVLKL